MGENTVSPDATLTLLGRAAEGDLDALNRLFERFRPALQRWGRGRLPRFARDISDTQDIVQDVLLQAFRNLAHFEYRGDGSLHAYLRHALMNRIRMEIRRQQTRPPIEVLESSQPDEIAQSPLERAIGAEAMQKYESALMLLSTIDREAVIARIEMGLSYQEIADAIGRPSPDAARMMVARALTRMARQMDLS